MGILTSSFRLAANYANLIVFFSFSLTPVLVNGAPTKEMLHGLILRGDEVVSWVSFRIPGAKFTAPRPESGFIRDGLITLDEFGIFVNGLGYDGAPSGQGRNFQFSDRDGYTTISLDGRNGNVSIFESLISDRNLIQLVTAGSC